MVFVAEIPSSHLDAFLIQIRFLKRSSLWFSLEDRSYIGGRSSQHSLSWFPFADVVASIQGHYPNWGIEPYNYYIYSYHIPYMDWTCLSANLCLLTSLNPSRPFHGPRLSNTSNGRSFSILNYTLWDLQDTLQLRAGTCSTSNGWNDVNSTHVICIYIYTWYCTRSWHRHVEWTVSVSHVFSCFSQGAYFSTLTRRVASHWVLIIQFMAHRPVDPRGSLSIFVPCQAGSEIQTESSLGRHLSVPGEVRLDGFWTRIESGQVDIVGDRGVPIIDEDAWRRMKRYEGAWRRMKTHAEVRRRMKTHAERINVLHQSLRLSK